MNRIAIMQPYFFPYIGYWQLIHAADSFILFDDAQYMRHGWVNRNRILKPDGGWQYILVPLKKHEMTEAIRSVQAHPDKRWRELIVAQLAHYKKKARYFRETIELVEESLFANDQTSISAINYHIIKVICSYLDLNKKIVVSSEVDFDYTNVSDAGEWALRMSEQLGASEYINPASGEALFDRSKFESCKIKLSFLVPNEIVYLQRVPFESSLSIIDVLMFNGKDGTKQLLENYSVHRG